MQVSVGEASRWMQNHQRILSVGVGPDLSTGD